MALHCTCVDLTLLYLDYQHYFSFISLAICKKHSQHCRSVVAFTKSDFVVILSVENLTKLR